jgi:DNA-binding NarL/FixJ family response regulator
MTATTLDAMLRVVLVDPDPLVRRFVRNELKAHGIVVAGDTGSCHEAVCLARYHHPDVVLCELQLDAVAVIRELPDTTVVVFSADAEPERILEALRAGAQGFVSKDVEIPALTHVLRRAADGEAIIPRALGAAMLEQLRRVPDRGWRPLHSQLTTREWEIIELLETGADTHTIAHRLVLSDATVYSHIKNILRKLRVHSREQAVHAARSLRPVEVHAAA